MEGYIKAAKMWNEGATVGEIIDALGFDAFNELISRGVALSVVPK